MALSIKYYNRNLLKKRNKNDGRISTKINIGEAKIL